ncbi:MAG: DUF4442 domain-containing protein [Bdellovibrionota bacterium]
MPFDPVSQTKHLSPKLRLTVLNTLLTIGIPFNKGLGLRLFEFTEKKVVVKSLPKRRRRNHVGGAHACALALLGEYPAGLLVAQQFPFSEYRIIIGELKVEYEKQGRGVLFSEVEAPDSWPTFDGQNDDLWITLKTTIHNESREVVARAETRWQIKPWSKVRSKKSAQS